MKQSKKYIAPTTDIFVLQPADRMMWEIEGTGGPQPGQAPYRY